MTDYVAFFYQYFGFTNNPVLAPFAHERCRCRRYFMGGDGAWTISTAAIFTRNWYCAHSHVLKALDGICKAGLHQLHQHQAGAHE